MFKTAKEMSKLTTERAELDISKIEQKISEEIGNAASRGYNCVYSYYLVQTPYHHRIKLIDKLRCLGYKIEQIDDQREQTSYITISW
jgi:hypothetical protein